MLGAARGVLDPEKERKRDMNFHYFNEEKADEDDIALLAAKGQGYVPDTCLLGGFVVMAEVGRGNSPCWGCAGPREKCKGKPRRGEMRR